jgi:hypothetical protein
MRRAKLVALLLASSVATAASADPNPPAATATSTPLALRAPQQPPPIPDWRFVVNNLLIFRYNPLGVEDQIRGGFQRRLLHSDKLLFRDTFIFFGAAPKLNPAFVKVGPSLELQPLSVLNLRFAAELVDFFGTFGYLQSFTSPLADYSETARSAADKIHDAAYGTDGVHVMIEPTLQVKLGPFALRDKFAAEYWRMNLHAGDTVFYDATLDTLVPGNGWVIANDLDALYVTKFGLTAGARYTVVHPFYRPSFYLPGEDSTINQNGHQRLGALIAYTFYDRGFTSFNKPSLLVICSWYLQHHYRAGGSDNAQSIPYVVVGFAFQSDLLKQ